MNVRMLGKIVHPSLRACHSCLENIQCIKLIVLTWNVDCESGNRKMAGLVNANHIQFPEFLVVVPDAVHASSQNMQMLLDWFLVLGEGHRSTLCTLRTLRNESNITIRETVHKRLIAEAVRNKDRMAVEPLLELTSQKLIDFLNSMKNAFVNIHPVRYRISDSNKRGLDEHSFAIFHSWHRKSHFSQLELKDRFIRSGTVAFT